MATVCEPPMEDPVIGIDLGTTYSCVAVWKDGNVQIIPNDMGKNITPSVVAFTSEEILVGQAAKNKASENPSNTIFDAKRLIGRRFTDDTVTSDRKHWPFTVVEGPGGKPEIVVESEGKERRLSPEQISAMVLEKMKGFAEDYLGQEVKNAVITVPAYFNDSQRQATKDAGTIAGLNVLRIINEPTAAAINFGWKTAEERKVLIYDLGGGTFDVTFLTIENGVFDVKATAGDTHLGGEDFDSRLADHFAAEFKRKSGKDITGDKRALSRLRAACEQVKIALSAGIKASLNVDALCDGVNCFSNIERSCFEDDLCFKLFKATLKPVERVLADSGFDKDEVDEVVLVGGSTRIPMVQSLLSDFFDGKKLNKTVNADEAVAFGAAVQGNILRNSGTSGATFEERFSTGEGKFSTSEEETSGGGATSGGTEELLLLDVTPLSLGVETQGGVMTVMIPRNATLPTMKSRSFSTSIDNQTSVMIKVFEGEHSSTCDNNLLGTFRLTEIPPMPRGTPKIEVTFSVDVNGILSAQAVEKSTGKEEKITITNDKGRLSDHEIERMVQEAEEFKLRNEANRKRFEARNALGKYLRHTRNAIAELDGIREKDRTSINALVEEGLDWHRDNEGAATEAIEEKHKELRTKISRIMP